MNQFEVHLLLVSIVFDLEDFFKSASLENESNTDANSLDHSQIGEMI